ncbi:MAG TPA: hypothetical protein VH257_07390 [Chloroflexota bacterium]|nr:hypothetical protein [Chloroflexota bacterium]
MEHPLQPSLEHPAGQAPPPVQPVLTGFEAGAAALPRPTLVPRAAAASRQKGRRRYWSIRDLSRRLWLGRGYELLRELVRSGILPATRSARSWWIDDADVLGLRVAFDDRAGKVRAFGAVEGWLRERCWAIPEGPETRALSAVPGASPEGTLLLRWRGTAYLPHRTWRAEATPNGGLVYRHRSGVALPAPAGNGWGGAAQTGVPARL